MHALAQPLKQANTFYIFSNHEFNLHVNLSLISWISLSYHYLLQCLNMSIITHGVIECNSNM